MTQAERIARHDTERARFGERFGPLYAAWLDAQPPVPHRTAWVPVANDNSTVANDNFPFEEAA